jgi:hypothetical protein
MRALEPPKGERRAMASMLSSFARGLEKGGEIARASRAGDDAAFRRNVDAALDALPEAQTSADRYGLVECARLGRVRPLRAGVATPRLVSRQLGGPSLFAARSCLSEFLLVVLGLLTQAIQE